MMLPKAGLCHVCGDKEHPVPAHEGPCADQPEMVFSELGEQVRAAEFGRDRSVQTMIGPSGYGVECTKWLLHMLNEDTEPGDRHTLNHWAWVGTAMHDRLDRDITASVVNTAGPSPRWLTEITVTVGQIAGKPIKGHVDVTDVAVGGIVDWKSCGTSSTAKMRAAIRKTGGVETWAHIDDFWVRGWRGGSPGGKYRAQLQGYGLGALLAGYPVKWVMDAFIPRNSSKADAWRSGEVWFWTEPFNAQVALDALDRCNGLADLIAGVGIDAALEMFAAEQCTESHCPWCPKARQTAGPSTTADDPFGTGLQ